MATKRNVLFSFLLFLLPIGVDVLVPLPARSGEAPGSKYALLIGVNKYDNAKSLGRDANLNFADNDAEQMAKALVGSGFLSSQVVTLNTGKDAKSPLYPRAANIRQQLKTLTDKLQDGDTILLAFSGYEMQYVGSDEYYFCPADADGAKKQNLIALSEICDVLNKSKAGAKMVLVDACRSLEGTGDKKAGQPKIPGKDIAVLFACSPGEFAYEVADKKQGIFSSYFCEGIRGAADADKDGRVNWTEMVGYLQTNVTSHVKTRLNLIQRPNLLGNTKNVILSGDSKKKG